MNAEQTLGRAKKMFDGISDQSNFPELVERPEWAEIQKMIVCTVKSHQALLEAAKLFVDRHRQVPAVPAGNGCVCGDCSRFKDAIAQAGEI